MRRGKSNCLIHGLLFLCATLILGAMAAMTRGVISTERERARMEAEAEEQERLRLALWRIDAAAAAWIADEAQRPLPDSRLMETEAARPEVKLRFDAREDGQLIADDAGRAGELRQALGLDPAGAAFPLLCMGMPEIPSNWAAVPPPEPEVAGLPAENRKVTAEYQMAANAKEFAGRSRALGGAVGKSMAQFNNVNVDNVTLIGGWRLQRGSLPRPARFGKDLFLLRHLQWERQDGSTLRSIQGAWLDENAFKAMLLQEIADLFPAATLIPAGAAGAGDGLALASFPWRISPGNGKPPPAPLPESVMLTLGAGWVAAVLAIGAAWLLVGGLMRLSERRASFVSAVTHELRTPLTTFQLYSGMLESGVIKEEKRGHYFQTLRREAERLSHLVENVLAFSRIERGSARSAPDTLSAGKLVAPMLERLDGRLGEAGLKLDADLDAPGWQSGVRADPAAVEHILFNLIDNASKYAAGSDPAEVRLEAEAKRGAVEIRVRDHGRGISRNERKKVFRAFHKSAAAAAESRPGVGLGLALSRRLARAGGGDLRLEGGEGGACFTLVLPGVS